MDYWSICTHKVTVNWICFFTWFIVLWIIDGCDVEGGSCQTSVAWNKLSDSVAALLPPTERDQSLQCVKEKAQIYQQDFAKFWTLIITVLFCLLVKYERIKFLVLALKNSVEVYAWAPKPYHKFMAFKVNDCYITVLITVLCLFLI